MRPRSMISCVLLLLPFGHFGASQWMKGRTLGLLYQCNGKTRVRTSVLIGPRIGDTFLSMGRATIYAHGLRQDVLRALPSKSRSVRICGETRTQLSPCLLYTQQREAKKAAPQGQNLVYKEKPCTPSSQVFSSASPARTASTTFDGHTPADIGPFTAPYTPLLAFHDGILGRHQ